MQRRSFLAMLGLAPVVASVPAAAKEEGILQNGTLITDLIEDGHKPTVGTDAEISVITRSWTCSEFAAVKASAALQGRELRPTGIVLMDRSDAPDWLQAMVPERQPYVHTATYKGRIVHAMWWDR